MERVRSDSKGGDVDLVAGPRTVDAVVELGALDELCLLALPMLAGDGMKLTPALRTNIALTFADARNWPNGVIELTYRIDH